MVSFFFSRLEGLGLVCIHLDYPFSILILQYHSPVFSGIFLILCPTQFNLGQAWKWADELNRVIWEQKKHQNMQRSGTPVPGLENTGLEKNAHSMELFLINPDNIHLQYLIITRTVY